MLLPFLGGGFVPVDSLPGPLAAFARYRPVTPVVDVLRALPAGTPADRGQVLVAVAWCAGLTVLGICGAVVRPPRSAR